MEISVVEISQNKVGTVQAEFFPVVDTSTGSHVCYLFNRQRHAFLRAGTASTQTRSEVSGGGKKPYKQKGTGSARRGSNRTPLRPGGGISFGPKPRAYGFKLNQKVSVLALKKAFSLKQQNISILRVPLETLKTSQVVSFLKGIGASSKSRVCLVLDNNQDFILELAARNLSNVTIIYVRSIDIDRILNADFILVTEAAFTTLKEKVIL